MDYDKKEKEIMPTLTIRHKRHWFEPKLPPIYKILSDAFFAIWLVRLVLIRKRYYKIVTNVIIEK